MANKERKSITVREAQEALQQLNLSYGRGAQIVVDEDFNFELADQPDLAEETPEESLKRAERQEKNDGQPVDEPKSKAKEVAVVKEEKSAQALKDRNA